MIEYLLKLDRDLFLFLNNGLHSEYLNGVFIFLTDKKSMIVPMILFVVLLLWIGGKRGAVIVLGVAAAVGLSDFISSGLIKPLVGRSRPCQTEVGTWYCHYKKNPVFWEIADGIKNLKRSWSFPSGHATNSMTFAFFISLYYRKAAYLLLPLSLLVGFSRIYVGVHFPLDVLAGFSLGIFIAFWMKYLTDIVIHKYIKTQDN